MWARLGCYSVPSPSSLGCGFSGRKIKCTTEAALFCSLSSSGKFPGPALQTLSLSCHCLSPPVPQEEGSFKQQTQLSPAGHHDDRVGRAMGMEVSLSLSPAEPSPAEDTQAKLVILSTAEPSWAQQLKSGNTTQTIPAFGRFVHLFFHCLVLGDWEHHLGRASAILSLSQQPSTLCWGGKHILYIKHLLFGILLLLILCCSSVFLIVLLLVSSKLLSQPISAFVPLSLELEWGEQEQLIWSLILSYF